MSTRWVRASVAAKGLGVSERTVHALTHDGTIRVRPWSRPLEVNRASVRQLIFDRQRHESRSGIQFETDIIPATVTCTDIADELPWELEQQAGSFVVRYPAQKSRNANPAPADDD